jgi:hypothetical protein
MTANARWVYWLAAWLFVASVVVQVFLAGLALFAGESFQLHALFGFTAVHVLSLLLIPLALLSRAGRRSVWSAVALFIVVTLQVALPGLREVVPFVAAIHPVVALLIFWLGIDVARHAGTLRGVPAANRRPAATEPAEL